MKPVVSLLTTSQLDSQSKLMCQVALVPALGEITTFDGFLSKIALLRGLRGCLCVSLQVPLFSNLGFLFYLLRMGPERIMLENLS